MKSGLPGSLQLFEAICALKRESLVPHIAFLLLSDVTTAEVIEIPWDNKSSLG